MNRSARNRSSTSEQVKTPAVAGWGVGDVTVRYGSVVALDSVTIEVAPGEIVGVIGGDGAGKSTLLKVLAGERLDISGNVSIPDASEIGFVPATGGFYRDLTVGENIEFIAAAFGLTAWRSRAGELLQRAELDQFDSRLAGRLSGGQQRKLAATMAILPTPRLLVMDEVTTGVDPVSRMALWRILGTAAAAETSIIIATTYLDEAERTNTVVLLEAGKVLASGPPAEIVHRMPGTLYELDAPVDDATAWRHGRRWRQWVPADGPSTNTGAKNRKSTPGGPDPTGGEASGDGRGGAGNRADNRPGTTDGDRRVSDLLAADPPIQPRLEDAAIVLELIDRGVVGQNRDDSARRRLEGPNPETRRPVDRSDPDRSRTPAVRAVGVSHRFGSFLAVDRVDLTVDAGEIVGLIGANGAGKTTLIKMLLGILAPSGGSLSVLGGPVTRSTRRQIGYVPQHLGLYLDLTANENLAFQAAAYGMSTPDRFAPFGDQLGDRHDGNRQLRDQQLGNRQLGDRQLGDRLIGDVPLGVQRRVAFTAAVQHGPRLLILDEPTSGVSPLGRSRLWDVIHDQADRGVAVLVSTHYMDEARQADRIAMLAHGQLVAHGTLDEVLDDRTVVSVAASDWSGAFNALDGVAGWTRLDGRAVRVVGSSKREVDAALQKAGIDAAVSVVPATLDEVLALHDEAQRPATPPVRQ